jgi:hypothetical protein
MPPRQRRRTSVDDGGGGNRTRVRSSNDLRHFSVVEYTRDGQKYLRTTFGDGRSKDRRFRLVGLGRSELSEQILELTKAVHTYAARSDGVAAKTDA